jgi:hypothetical protein
MTVRTCGAAVIVAGMLLAATAAAQVPNPPSPRLVAITSLKCTFPVLATGTWKAGEPVASTKAAKLAVAFTSIDTQEGTADAVGGAGKAHITVRVVGNYLNLMQMDPYGALYVTTVFNTESRPGKLQAVHTRHEYTPVSVPGFTSRPEQYYGDCDVIGR